MKLYTNKGYMLDKIDPTRMKELQLKFPTIIGIPVMWTLVGEEIVVWPKPDNGVEVLVLFD